MGRVAYLTLICLFIFSIQLFAQNSSVMLSNGLVLPVLSTSERETISNPSKGQVIFNKNLGQIEVFDGTAWRKLLYYNDQGNLTDMESYYRFSGNANDEKNKNNGTIYNAILTEDRFGNSNSAYYFNGTNSYIDMGPNLGNLTNTNPISISAWFKGEGTITSKYVNYELPKCSFFMASWGVTGIGLNVGPASTLFVPFIPDINKWHHFVVVYTEFVTKIYINGELVSTGFLNLNTNPTTTSFIIGLTLPDLNYFKGSIDEVRVFNRQLSSEEIYGLYLYEK